MNRCDECKHKDSCVCVPYGCECFELDIVKHDSELLDKVAERIKGRCLFRGIDGNPYRDTVDKIIEELKAEVR